MAGIVDSHVHVNDRSHRVGRLGTATRAAARGGVCILADMPLNSAPVTTSRLHWQKIHSMEGSSGWIVLCGAGSSRAMSMNLQVWLRTVSPGLKPSCAIRVSTSFQR